METHYKNLYNQFRRTITRETAWEAVMRTRFSKGIKISSFITPTLISNEDLMVLPSVDSDQSYTFNLEIVDQSTEQNQTTSSQLILETDIFYLQVKWYYNIDCFVVFTFRWNQKNKGIKYRHSLYI